MQWLRLRGVSLPEYPQQEKADRLLRFLNDELQKSYDRGLGEVRLMFVSGGSFGDEGAGLFLESGGRAGVGDKIGTSNGEALAIFRRLDKEGYIYADFGRERNKDTGFVQVEGLSERGYVQIGELANPRDEFLQRLDAIEEAIRTLQDPNVSEDQKEEAKKAIGTNSAWASPPAGHTISSSEV